MIDGCIRACSEGAGPPLGPVDGDVGAVDPGGALGQYEGDDVGDFLGRTEASPRKFAALEFGESLGVLGAKTLPAAALEHDRAGAHRVDADVQWRKLPGKRPRQENLTRFGGAVLWIGAGLPARNRRNGDRAAAAAGLHVRDRRANCPYSVEKIQIKSTQPILR